MTDPQSFWTWFAENHTRFEQLNQSEQREELLDELLNRLHEVCPDLYFQIGGKPNQPTELIISAEGNLDYFGEVERLVRQAPEIPNWKIIPFKPAHGFDFVLKYHDIEFDAHQMSFLPLEHPDHPEAIGLRIGHKDYTKEEDQAFVTGTFLLLDTAIGEKSAAMDIDFMEVVTLPDNLEDTGYIELIKLAEYIAWKRGGDTGHGIPDTHQG